MRKVDRYLLKARHALEKAILAMDAQIEKADKNGSNADDLEAQAAFQLLLVQDVDVIKARQGEAGRL